METGSESTQTAAEIIEMYRQYGPYVVVRELIARLFITEAIQVLRVHVDSAKACKFAYGAAGTTKFEEWVRKSLGLNKIEPQTIHDRMVLLPVIVVHWPDNEPQIHFDFGSWRHMNGYLHNLWNRQGRKALPDPVVKKERVLTEKQRRRQELEEIARKVRAAELQRTADADARAALLRQQGEESLERRLRAETAKAEQDEKLRVIAEQAKEAKAQKAAQRRARQIENKKREMERMREQERAAVMASRQHAGALR